MKKILFIEDEETLQRTFKEILKRANYEMFGSLDGEDGLKTALNEKPDLILLDLILPKMHGLEVLKELKSKPETKNIPVIILTNLEGTEEIEKALELGATTYLVKTSYSLEEIIKKIRKIIGD